MRIVVTGTSGQVGSYLMEHLSKKHDVLGLDNRPCPYPDIEKNTRIVDVCLEKDLGRYLKGADWVIHCAAQVSVERSMKDPIFDANNNVLGTLNMLWNSFLHEAGHFLYVSSAAVFGNPQRVPIDEDHPTIPMSPYGASKLCGEKYVQAFSAGYGLSTVIVRPFNIYSKRADPESPYSGVITKFVGWAKQGKPLLVEGDGEQTRDFVHISDVLQMIDLVMKKASISLGRTFNCGSGKACSINALAETVRNLAGNRSEIKHVAPRQGDIRHSCADITLAREKLDYAPQMELEDGIRELLG
ncbi:MAG: NAD-dependent epimerase/dehydratase family protein [Thermoplasmata archaeon]